MSGEPIALISDVLGEAIREGESLEPSDLLYSGDEIEVVDESSLSIAFASGSRWIVHGPAKVDVNIDSLSGPEEALEPLRKLDAFPAISALALDERAGVVVAGLRVRGPEDDPLGLDPFPKDARIPFDAPVRFHFLDVTSVERWTFEIIDVGANVVLSTETTSPELEVAAGVLKPGASYWWRGSATNDQELPSPLFEVGFETISEELTNVRRTLWNEIGASASADDLALLVALDGRFSVARQVTCQALEARRTDETKHLALDISRWCTAPCEVP